VSTPVLSALPIRRLTARDLAACADLSEDRGWPREEHKWSLLLAAGDGYGIDDPDGGLVSACVVTTYGALQGPGLEAIGMVLVAERHARKGVGRRLMRHVIEEAGATPMTLYATSNGRPLYEQLGFKALGESETVRGRFVADGTDTGVTRSATAEDLPTLLRLDHEVFGADRTHVLTRLPAFCDQLRVAESGGTITGYAAAWPNTTNQVVGPLVARDADTAKALVASLATSTDLPLRTDVDVRHEELLTWLKDRGLSVGGVNTIMAHGLSELPGDWARRFAPVTVAAG
jgi:GNAT superfamily N-acetyltransferase